MSPRNGLPRYVSEFRDRHGKWRYVARRRGWPTIYLKAAPHSEAFMAEYRAWRDNAPRTAGEARTVAGSVADVVARYYRSTDYVGLAPSTKMMVRNILERFREEHGEKSFVRLDRAAVQRMVDGKAPDAGRNFLKRLRALARVAISGSLRTDDPTLGVRTIRRKSDGFHSTTEAEILAFEAKHPLGTRARLAHDLLLYTGQRRGDVVRLGPQHVREGRICLKQAKTGAALAIPIHPALKASIEATRSGHLTFLVTAGGKPFSPAGFGNWFRECCDEAGLPDCSAHGLRKAAARRLAEAGCSASQIAAITGHASLAEVSRYVRGAEQVRLADQAMARMITNREHEVSNPDARLDKSGAK
jgi:integrase